MHSFAETLHRVRLERGFTQEQLAQELNVSRQTISHWENGRAYPDIDTIKRIFQVLGCDLLTEDAPVSEEVPAAEAPVKASGRKLRILFTALAMVLLIAVAFSAGVMARQIKNKKAAAFVTEPHTYEWYLTDQDPMKGQAYARIEATEDPILNNGAGHWYYTFEAYFSGDADFCVERIYIQYFKNGTCIGREQITEQARFIELIGNPWFRPGDVLEWNGGTPVQNHDHVGIAIEGTDSNGNHLIFTGDAELSKELRK